MQRVFSENELEKYGSLFDRLARGLERDRAAWPWVRNYRSRVRFLTQRTALAGSVWPKISRGGGDAQGALLTAHRLAGLDPLDEGVPVASSFRAFTKLRELDGRFAREFEAYSDEPQGVSA